MQILADKISAIISRYALSLILLHLLPGEQISLAGKVITGRQDCALHYHNYQTVTTAEAHQPNPIAHGCTSNSSAIYFSTKERSDGAGSYVSKLLDAEAYAMHHRWNYAGISVPHTSHNVDIKQILDFIYHDYRTTLQSNCLPINAAVGDSGSMAVITVHSMLELANITQAIARDREAVGNMYCGRTNPNRQLLVHYKGNDFTISAVDQNKYIDEAFLSLIRNRSKSNVERFTKLGPGPKNTLMESSNQEHKRLSVVVHMRRGDVSKSVASRWISTAWYMDVLGAIVSMYPTSDIHIYTTYCHHRPKTGLKSCNNARLLEDIKMLRSKGFHVHARNESTEYAKISHSTTLDVLTDLAHMAAADVLIMGKSSFSLLGAYLNPNCVVYNPFYNKPLRHWIKVHRNISMIRETIEIVKTELPKCIGDFF